VARCRSRCPGRVRAGPGGLDPGAGSPSFQGWLPALVNGAVGGMCLPSCVRGPRVGCHASLDLPASAGPSVTNAHPPRCLGGRRWLRRPGRCGRTGTPDAVPPPRADPGPARLGMPCMWSPSRPAARGGGGLLGSGEGFGPGHVGVSRVRQDLKPAALAPSPRPVDADAFHCYLLASRGVRWPL
jgi:hypothetical protein